MYVITQRDHYIVITQKDCCIILTRFYDLCYLKLLHLYDICGVLQSSARTQNSSKRVELKLDIEINSKSMKQVKWAHILCKDFMTLLKILCDCQRRFGDALNTFVVSHMVLFYTSSGNWNNIIIKLLYFRFLLTWSCLCTTGLLLWLVFNAPIICILNVKYWLSGIW